MGTYINSKGEQIDTATLAEPHLLRALAKAQREGNEQNTKALEEELTVRNIKQ